MIQVGGMEARRRLRTAATVKQGGTKTCEYKLLAGHCTLHSQEECAVQVLPSGKEAGRSSTTCSASHN